MQDRVPAPLQLVPIRAGAAARIRFGKQRLARQQTHAGINLRGIHFNFKRLSALHLFAADATNRSLEFARYTRICIIFSKLEFVFNLFAFS